MAFVWTLENQQLAVTETNGTIIIFVGEDDEDNVRYATYNGFAPMVGGAAEYVFCLVSFDLLGGSEYKYWNGADVAKFVSKPDRAKLLDTFVYGARVLLEVERPPAVFMCAPVMPEAAIRKYALMADVFKEAGYEVTEAAEQLGVMAWWMELPKAFKG